MCLNHGHSLDRKSSKLPFWLERMIERGDVSRRTAHGRYYRVTPPVVTGSSSGF